MNDARLFSTLHHVCVVVCDIEKSVAYYESVGVGPWHDYPPLESYQDDLTVPDREAFFGLKYKYANLGNVQIQLCEPGEGEAPSGASWTRAARGSSTSASWFPTRMTRRPRPRSSASNPSCADDRRTAAVSPTSTPRSTEPA